MPADEGGRRRCPEISDCAQLKLSMLAKLSTRPLRIPCLPRIAKALFTIHI